MALLLLAAFCFYMGQSSRLFDASSMAIYSEFNISSSSEQVTTNGDDKFLDKLFHFNFSTNSLFMEFIATHNKNYETDAEFNHRLAVFH